MVFASNSWEALGFLWTRTLVMVVTFETDDDHSIKEVWLLEALKKVKRKQEQASLDPLIKDLIMELLSCLSFSLFNSNSNGLSVFSILVF